MLPSEPEPFAPSPAASFLPSELDAMAAHSLVPSGPTAVHPFETQAEELSSKPALQDSTMQPEL